MARRRANDKAAASAKPETVEQAPTPVVRGAVEDGISGPRALAFSKRLATPAEYLRDLLVVAVVAFDHFTKE